MNIMVNQGRKSMFLVVAGLAAVFAVVDYHLNTEVPRMAAMPTGPKTLSGGAGIVSTADVPDDVVRDIARQLGAVQGLNDLLVLSDSKRSGYDVTATVDLGYAMPFDQTQMDATIKQDVNAFLLGVYGSKEKVVNAQVFFTQKGQTVGGAGLGVAAFHMLAKGTLEVGTETLADVLQHSGHSDHQDENDAWIEMFPPQT